MSKPFICLIVLFHYSGAKFHHSDKPAITFRFNENYVTVYDVATDKPLAIVLDNFFAHYFWCLNFYYAGPEDEFVKHTSLNGTSDSVINVPKLTDAMMTRWWCTVLQDYRYGESYLYHGRRYKPHHLVFNLHSIYAISAHKEITDYESIYIAAGCVFIIVVIIIFIIIMVKKYCCQKPRPRPKLPVNPNDIFYLNLEVFRREYERELEQQEPEYEEIN